MIRTIAVAALLAVASACAPDESSVGAVIADGGAGRDGHDGGAPRRGWWPWRHAGFDDQRALAQLPLSAVTGTAASSDGIVAGGVSAEAERFWDAWLIPFDGAPARRLAPIGDRLVSVDADGALWTGVATEDESGAATFEIRLSPADGSPSVLLSPELPDAFSADRALAAADGGRLLIGTEGPDGAAHLAAFAIDANGHARRLPCPTSAASPLVVGAVLAAGSIQIEVLYAADEPTKVVSVPVGAPAP